MRRARRRMTARAHEEAGTLRRARTPRGMRTVVEAVELVAVVSAPNAPDELALLKPVRLHHAEAHVEMHAEAKVERVYVQLRAEPVRKPRSNAGRARRSTRSICRREHAASRRAYAGVSRGAYPEEPIPSRRHFMRSSRRAATGRTHPVRPRSPVHPHACTHQ